jgi:N-acetylmuramoyl-L-alanine amidase
MRHSLIRRIQQFFLLFSALLALTIGALAGQRLGLLPDNLLDLLAQAEPVDSRPTVALISGHAGFDSGAVCQDGQGRVLLTEAEVNAQIAQQVYQRLLTQGNVRVLLLEEYDAELNGLRADLLLSLHADSCIGLSGYKAAHRANSPIPETEGRLLACIEAHYGPGTGLSPHPNTITHDMTAYHAFRRMDSQTPAAILEMGFLGGDQRLLTQEQRQVAAAIVASVNCFLGE